MPFFWFCQELLKCSYLKCFPFLRQAIVPGRESEKYTHLVGVDFYYLEYEVKVGTYNKHGDGPNSTVEVVYSAEGSK